MEVVWCLVFRNGEIRSVLPAEQMIEYARFRERQGADLTLLALSKDCGLGGRMDTVSIFGLGRNR